MCGRFTLDLDKRFYPRFNLSDKELIFFEANYNIAPGNNSIIITNEKTVNKAIEAKFGYIPVWSKSETTPYSTINAKAETILEKPMFKSSVKSSRCLVPVTGFYEWRVETDDSKTPFYFYNKGEKYFSLAGIHSTWEDKNSNTKVNSFAIITTKPNKSIEGFHHRMPLILNQEDEMNWINNNLEQDVLERMLYAKVETELSNHQVTKKVNYAGHNSPDLISKI